LRKLICAAEDTDLAKAMDELGVPLVVKIPDGSFSCGVHKAETQGRDQISFCSQIKRPSHWMTRWEVRGSQAKASR
jgi:glutathione synthase/RimK-type ligase-like ATP-grasp enzyme